MDDHSHPQQTELRHQNNDIGQPTDHQKGILCIESPTSFTDQHVTSNQGLAQTGQNEHGNRHWISFDVDDSQQVKQGRCGEKV